MVETICTPMEAQIGVFVLKKTLVVDAVMENLYFTQHRQPLTTLRPILRFEASDEVPQTLDVQSPQSVFQYFV